MFNFKLFSSLKGLLAQSCIRYIGLRLHPECLTLVSAALTIKVPVVHWLSWSLSAARVSNTYFSGPVAYYLCSVLYEFLFYRNF